MLKLMKTSPHEMLQMVVIWNLFVSPAKYREKELYFSIICLCPSNCLSFHLSVCLPVCLLHFCFICYNFETIGEIFPQLCVYRSSSVDYAPFILLFRQEVNWDGNRLKKSMGFLITFEQNRLLFTCVCVRACLK